MLIGLETGEELGRNSLDFDANINRILQRLIAFPLDELLWLDW